MKRKGLPRPCTSARDRRVWNRSVKMSSCRLFCRFHAIDFTITCRWFSMHLCSFEPPRGQHLASLALSVEKSTSKHNLRENVVFKFEFNTYVPKLVSYCYRSSSTYWVLLAYLYRYVISGATYIEPFIVQPFRELSLFLCTSSRVPPTASRSLSFAELTLMIYFCAQM